MLVNLSDSQTIRLWMSYLAAAFKDADAQEELFVPDPDTEISTTEGSAVRAFRIVDNPGDAPSYALVALLDHETGPGEALWCYLGRDAAHPDGITICPIGVDYYEASLVVMTGLADALFLPSKACARARKQVGRLQGDFRRLAGQLLNGIEDLLEHASGIDVAAASDDGLRSVEEDAQLMVGRIASLRKELSSERDATLPFGRSPVSL